jgi:two-component system LytT family response regulator
MSTIKVVIVEDEKKSREMLKNLLDTFCPEVICGGMADSVKTGLDLIKNTKPDIVFLDIEMQSGTGFDLLQQLEDLNFEVIFTTAFAQYAIKAIKFNALDYLLKPIDVDDMKAAVAKAVKKRQNTNENMGLQELVNAIKNKNVQRISISTLDGVIFVELDDIIRCEAKGAYTFFYLRNGSNITASKNLKEYEQLLCDYQFIRIHHSHIINLSEVHKYIKTDGGIVQMKDGSKVSISQNRKDVFLERMKLE